jgi:hypothetical protein
MATYVLTNGCHGTALHVVAKDHYPPDSRLLAGSFIFRGNYYLGDSHAHEHISALLCAHT